MTLMQSIPGPGRSIAPQTPQRIAIVTDAWHPQMNGVVRTLSTTCEPPMRAVLGFTASPITHPCPMVDTATFVWIWTNLTAINRPSVMHRLRFRR